MFIGSYLFEFIGALFKWLLQYPLSLVTKRKPKSFKKIWNGPGSREAADFLFYGFSNIFFGAVILAILIFLVLWKRW